VSTEPSSPSPFRRVLVALALLALVATTTVAWTNHRSARAAVVAYGESELTADQLAAILETLPETAPQIVNGTMSASITGQLIRQWIFNQAIVEELAARDWSSTGDDRTRAIADINDPGFPVETAFGVLTLDTLEQSNAGMRLAEAMVVDVPLAYPEYLCSSHILVSTEAEAAEIVALLADGDDFATLAQARSLDGSGATGGDLGCGPTMNYVTEFSDGARATGVGISVPVESQFGWHVIAVRSIGPLTPENHPEMGEDRVRQALGSFEVQAVEQLASQYFDEILIAAWDRTANRVDLDARYGTWDADRAVIVEPSGLD